MVNYPNSSPYFLSNVVENQFLDVMINRPIPTDETDVLWDITPTYNLRPDLLAYDLYGDSKFWWVFAQRNPNTIKDPLFDFTTGKSIYLTKLTTLQQYLGV
jgi:hypothetical protein